MANLGEKGNGEMVRKIWKGDERWIFTTSEFIDLYRSRNRVHLSVY